MCVIEKIKFIYNMFVAEGAEMGNCHFPILFYFLFLKGGGKGEKKSFRLTRGERDFANRWYH